jgi:hypothetical protein
MARRDKTPSPIPEEEILMFKKLVVAAAMLSAVPSFAITRVVECNRTADPGRFLTIVLRGGMAYLFECAGHCDGGVDPVEIAVMSGSSDTENSITYSVTQGSYPATSSFKIRFPQSVEAPVELTLDGRSGDYSCR